MKNRILSGNGIGAGVARMFCQLGLAMHLGFAAWNKRRLATEVLTRRVRHFTQWVILGSRSWMDRWFESNRQVVQSRSRTERKRGAKSLGQPALRGLYAFRVVK